MPITYIRLKLSQLDDDTQRFIESVVDFFKRNEDLAYNEAEIREELVGPTGPGWQSGYVSTLLEDLTDFGVLDERIVQGTPHFIFVKDLDSI